MHGHDGNALGYAALARRLTTGHPFYGIEARSVPDGEAGALTVEALGRAYAAEVRAFQPAGPYFLGGRCMGGAIALEIARSIAAAGEEVALLALVDPRGERLGPLPYYRRRLSSFRRRGRLARGLLGFPLRHVRATRAAGRETPLQHAMREAIGGYAPSPYEGRIALLRDDLYVTPPAFWERIALEGVEAYAVVPAEEKRLPAGEVARILAEQLDDALGAAAARAPVSMIDRQLTGNRGTAG